MIRPPPISTRTDKLFPTRRSSDLKARAGGYARNALVTTFAGAFPIDNPRYVVVAMLDEPKGTKDTYGFATAGWNTAPVVSKVVSRIGPILGVVPTERKDADWHPQNGSASCRARVCQYG